MKPPETPDDEPLRLAKLRSLGLLDTGQDSRFDRLTRLAQRIFKVPIAMVSLVDEHRQWPKSSAGVHASEASRPSEQRIGKVVRYSLEGIFGWFGGDFGWFGGDVGWVGGDVGWFGGDVGRFEGAECRGSPRRLRRRTH